MVDVETRQVDETAARPMGSLALVQRARQFSATDVEVPILGLPRGSRHNADFGLPSLADDVEFSQDFIDSFGAEAAILDQRGGIILASKSWRARSDRAELASGRNTSDATTALDFLASEQSTVYLIRKKVAEILSGSMRQTELNFGSRRRSLKRYRLRIAALGKGTPHFAIAVNDDVTETYQLQREKRLLADQLMRSEEQERGRIAREMHDSTVQDLVAIGLNLKRLRHLADDPVAQEVLAEVRSILTRTQQDVRTLSYLLHPPLLDEGGVVLALASLIQGLSSRMQIRIAFESNFSDSRLPIEIEIALYRIAQEALINVHKHASATHAVVQLNREAERLILKIEDDGVGINSRHAYHVGSGVGIQGMRARLTQLGGALTLSTLKQGTRLRAVLPIGPATST